MQRRNFLKIIGGGVVIAAGAATTFAATRVPTKALAPWDQAGQYEDPRLRALSHAILAPNPHNRQPWKVALDGDNALTLWFDLDKQLPHTDPFDRQLTIGLGCFLELMRMAAQADGYSTTIDLFPEGFDETGLDERPIAYVQFAKAEGSIDPLWQYVARRRSNKEPYDTQRMISQQDIDTILAATNVTQAGGSVDPDSIAFWRDLSSRALMIEIETEHTYKESVDLFRIGKAEVNADPDGIDFTGVMFDGLSKIGMFTREEAMNRSSMTYTQGVAAVLENTETAMGHLWLVTETNTRLDQIATGADWLRVNLAATAAGLGFQPLSQALQEYPEMAELYAQTHSKLAPNGGTVQMLARIGYGPEISPSPRWPIEKKLVTA